MHKRQGDKKILGKIIRDGVLKKKKKKSKLNEKND